MIREIVLSDLPNLSLSIQKIHSDDHPDLRGRHFHKEIELVCAEKGTLFCDVNDTRINLQEGQILLINSHTIHQLSFGNDDCSFTYIQIDIMDYLQPFPSADRNFTNILHSNRQKNHILFDAPNEIGEIFERIQKELTEKRSNFEAYIRAYISLIVACMYRNDLLLSFDQFRKDKHILRFLPVLEYIETNFQSKIGLDDVCPLLKINKYNFCKDFKKAMGYTLIEYINLRRLVHAQQLLLETDKSILNIALESGFPSVQHFNKCFKAYKACSPKAYQKMYTQDH